MKFFLGLLVLGTVSTARAEALPKYDPFPDAERVVRSIEDGGLADEVMATVDNLLVVGTEQLKLKGHTEVAEQIFTQWQFLARRWDLGDHAPLLPFLSNAYTKMEKFLGKGIMRSLYLTDLHIINHALPVVMNPKSRDWDRAEYKKHFVPLFSVIAYWGTYFGCRAAIDWTFLSKVCKPAAGVARWWMTKYAGPALSDRVYRFFVRP